jgi:Tfp pilus assembly protein FimV
LISVNRLQHLLVTLSEMATKSSNLMALLTMAPSAFAGGDIGALPRIKSLSALKVEVQRHFGKLSSQELEALVGWFNRNFFRLET